MFRSRHRARHAWFVGRASDFIAAVAEDETLRTWVLSLEDASDDERAVQVARVARRMRGAGEDEQLVRVIESMRHRPIYDGLLRTLRDVA